MPLSALSAKPPSVTAVCPASIRSADMIIIGKANKKLFINWLLIVVFVLLFLLCSWAIGKNLVEIYTIVSEWKANVRATRAERSKGFHNDLTDATLDDEQYPNTRDHDNLRPENDAIRKKIARIKRQYANYNRALLKSGKGPGTDEVNEKIIDEMHDEYAPPKPTDEEAPLDVQKSVIR